MLADLQLDSIRTDGGTQPRSALDPSTVAEYASALEHGDTFPPVVVFSDDARLWLADGFHRVAAARQLGRESIAADVRQGTRHDAFRFSLGANATHGLRRTRADKRRAVDAALADPVIGALSDREIARICALSHTFVSTARAALLGGNVATPLSPMAAGLWVARLAPPRAAALVGASRAHPGFVFVSIVDADSVVVIDTVRPIRIAAVPGWLEHFGVDPSALFHSRDGGPFGSAAELVDAFAPEAAP